MFTEVALLFLYTDNSLIVYPDLLLFAPSLNQVHDAQGNHIVELLVAATVHTVVVADRNQRILEPRAQEETFIQVHVSGKYKVEIELPEGQCIFKDHTAAVIDQLFAGCQVANRETGAEAAFSCPPVEVKLDGHFGILKVNVLTQHARIGNGGLTLRAFLCKRNFHTQGERAVERHILHIPERQVNNTATVKAYLAVSPVAIAVVLGKVKTAYQAGNKIIVLFVICLCCASEGSCG